MRSTYMLGTLGFGFSAWAVFLAGLAAIHGAVSTQNSYIAEFDSFAFGWLLAVVFLVVWIAIMLCWLRGTMPSSSRVLTPIIAILISWFGIKTQDILKLLLIAYRKDTMDGRFLVWTIGSIACSVCLGVMLIIVASWEIPADELSMIEAFRNSRGPRYVAPGGLTGGVTGGMSGAHAPVGGTSDAMYTSYGNIPTVAPFGESFGQEPFQESATLGNSAAQSGTEVTLNLNQKSAL